MKKLILASTLLFGLSSQARELPKFAAFADGEGNLIVSFMGDTCNNYMPLLSVADNCKEDRGQENFAYSCSVELQLASTRKGCMPGKMARAVTINLAEANIASEAEVLRLTFDNKEIEVQIGNNVIE